VIEVASQIAGQHGTQGDQQYLILLIITDGEITDMDNTISTIVNSSRLPMSIIM
jgi:hypothetical protein